MQFLENSPDIPDGLIRSVVNGDAVFLCGAGVSKPAGLPLFEELTDRVYETLGESKDSEPAERKAFEERQFDRVLRSLEKRTHRPGTKSLVRTAIANILETPVDIGFPDHLALLRLSRDAEGRPRLLTTNFDTLFEHAAAAADLAWSSYGGKGIPKPGGPRDSGILHLHGRLADSELGLDDTDLVLTSADFGDAYLRDGWASQYIEDRMRMNILVLVGYSAEDAALRLLLDTLDADRERFRDLKEIYVLEIRTDDSASIWKSKGIKPIEFDNYSDIYATLGEWASYTMKPFDYGRARVMTILTGIEQQAEMGE